MRKHYTLYMYNITEMLIIKILMIYIHIDANNDNNGISYKVELYNAIQKHELVMKYKYVCLFMYYIGYLLLYLLCLYYIQGIYNVYILTLLHKLLQLFCIYM